MIIQLFILLSIATPLCAQIISRSFFQPVEYQRLSPANKKIVPQADYERNKSLYERSNVLDWQQISYTVHKETVTGFIIIPRTRDQTKKYPAIFFNRGGSGDSGKITVREYSFFAALIDKGYIIFATQYRGVDGGTGTDNFGGNDIHDVLELIKAAQKESYIDPRNMFMLGFSRGGMMTYLALQGNVPLRAAASIAGISDLALCVEEWKEGAQLLRTTLAEYIPGFQEQSISMYESVMRSAVCFADEIKTPLLLMHGSQDIDIRMNQTNLLERSLQQAGCVHSVVRFNGGHEIPLQSLDPIFSWFENYKIN